MRVELQTRQLKVKELEVKSFIALYNKALKLRCKHCGHIQTVEEFEADYIYPDDTQVDSAFVCDECEGETGFTYSMSPITITVTYVEE